MKIVRFGMQMQETLGLLDDQNKVRSLKGVLEPLSTEQNLELLEQTGFYNSTIIHKTLCFDGILAIK